MKKKAKKVRNLTMLPAVVNTLDLTQEQKSKIYVPTPPEFIKKRKIRGGGMASYVEIGYVVKKLNEIFGVLNWNFQIIRETLTDKSVGVYGELTIKDHQRGYTLTKGQYGNHPRYPEIPIGDTLKAAASDCLKKCASMFGIALDVYWKELDRGEKGESSLINGQKTKFVVSDDGKVKTKIIEGDIVL